MSILRHWKMILGLLALFTAGLVAGMLLAVGGIMKMVKHQARPEVWVKARVGEMDRALKLNPEQREKVKPILEEAAGRVREIVRDGFGKMIVVVGETQDKISGVLDAEQKRTWETLRKEHLRRWREFATREAAKAPPKPL